MYNKLILCEHTNQDDGSVLFLYIKQNEFGKYAVKIRVGNQTTPFLAENLTYREAMIHYNTVKYQWFSRNNWTTIVKE